MPRNRSALDVLVVDDEVCSRRVVTEILKRLGHTCDQVTNGLEAAEAVSKTDYDLILMDCEMPEMDGFEAARRIRAIENQHDRRACIVAVTGSVSFNDEQRCFDAGMDAYIAKPVRTRRLQAVLGGLLADQGDPV